MSFCRVSEQAEREKRENYKLHVQQYFARQLKTDVDCADIHLTKLCAGLTNNLYCAQLSGAQPSEVLLRLYGSNTVALYDHSAELETFRQLAREGIAPRLLSSFPDGRIEEWLHGGHLSSAEFASEHFLVLIVEEVAKLHVLHLHSPYFAAVCERRVKLFDDFARWRKEVFRMWLSAENNVLSADQMAYIFKRSRVQSLQQLQLDTVFSETSALLEYLRSERCTQRFENCALMQRAFCHNDIHSLNVLRASGGVKLIDYEYAGCNCPAYDFAVIFTEMVTDYSVDSAPYFRFISSAAEFPSRARIEAALRPYFARRATLEQVPAPPDLARNVDAVLFMSLFVQLFSVYWGLLNAQNIFNSVQFDYLFFVLEKFRAYMSLKQHLLVEKIVDAF